MHIIRPINNEKKKRENETLVLDQQDSALCTQTKTYQVWLRQYTIVHISLNATGNIVLNENIFFQRKFYHLHCVQSRRQNHQKFEIDRKMTWFLYRKVISWKHEWVIEGIPRWIHNLAWSIYRMTPEMKNMNCHYGKIQKQLKCFNS